MGDDSIIEFDTEGVKKRFMFINRRAPYGSIYALEILEMVLISAAFEQETLSQENRFRRAIAFLLSAAGHAVEGDRDGADAFLNRARRLRADLYRGRIGDWEGGLLDRAFARFEPIAMGR